MKLKRTTSSIQNMYNKVVKNYSNKMSGTGFLYNKYLLYVTFAVCLINLLIWLLSSEFLHVAIFILVGYLTSFFSKNMIVVLVLSLVVSNVIKSGSNIVLEGMEDDKKKDSKKPDKKNDKKDTKKSGKKEGINNLEEESSEMEGADGDMEGADGEMELVDGEMEGADGDNRDMSCAVDTDCRGGEKCDGEKCVSAV